MMEKRPQTMFARWLFRIAGIYGLVVLAPQYFLETRIGHDEPPAITHPEFFYGFLGVALAWQVAFLIMAQAPEKYRPLMIPSIIEKFSFGFGAIVLFILGRASITVLGFALVDLSFGLLFALAYVRTSPAEESPILTGTEPTSRT